jgi:hypothetical protein
MDPQAPNVPPPEFKEPEIPKTPQVKENSPIATTSVAIFILLALGAIVFLYYQNQQLKNMLANYQSQPTASPTPTATADPTVNWKTYTDSGFSFKYPSEMSISTSSAANVSYLATADFKIGESGYQIQITKVTSNIQTIDKFEQIAPNTPEQTFLDKQSVMTINGNQVVVRTYKDAWSVYKKYYVYSPKLAVILQGTGQDHTIFDQILSTFKFINPTASPSGIPVACPQLAKQCPDGSYVSPTGPNCEFAPCPTP